MSFGFDKNATESAPAMFFFSEIFTSRRKRCWTREIGKKCERDIQNKYDKIYRESWFKEASSKDEGRLLQSQKSIRSHLRSFGGSTLSRVSVSVRKRDTTDADADNDDDDVADDDDDANAPA